MKQYVGQRTIDGIVVSVDGTPLDPRFDVHVYDEKGFEWSYQGSAPEQLALALLMDHLNDAERAKLAVASFTSDVIVNLDNDWRLTSDDIDKALSEGG
ncbi:MAG: DUF6166 domain-containing protein [Pseudomonadota bacterium]